MANEEENGFHGYRYLVDAQNSRQYAVRYDNGVPQKPFGIFAINAKEGSFKPNETIFALDDETEMTSANGKAKVSTMAFQFKTDGETEVRGFKAQAVEYDLSFVASPAKFEVIYQLTAESQRRLSDAGFDAGFPQSFTTALDPRDPGLVRDGRGSVTIDPGLLRNLSFPPHHDGGALIARQNVEAPTDLPVANRPDTTPVTKPSTGQSGKPSTTFNNQSGSTTTTPPRTLDKPKVPDAAIEAVIRQYCKDLTADAANAKLDPVVGRNQEIVDTIKILSRRKQASVCFTGEAGVGKSAMFAGVAQYIADDQDVPDSLRGARVLTLDLQGMNAGAKFRGQFEEKLKPLIDGLQEREGLLKGRKIILAIDEIHSQLTAGKAEGGTDAGNIMKPFLTSKGISVMGTTTSEEYKKHIEKDNALASRFEEKVLDSPDAASTKVILQKLWPLIKEHHGLKEDLADEDFDYIVNMTNRYAPNEAQPRKGEKALDMAAASAKFRHADVIEPQDMITAIAQMSKLSADFLSQSDNERFLKMREALPNEVLGQPGLTRIVDGLVGSRSGLNDPNQPWAAFVMQGPTGTGKTETAKALARYLFGSEDALIQLNMAEYSEKHTVSRLIGAPPGYVGFDTAEPALTERIRKRPYSILLLDEVEKAHADVFNILLGVLNDGKMSDNQGKKVLFNNVIVLMTSNLGAKEAMAALKGGSSGSFDNAASEMPAEKQAEILAKKYETARGQFFRPEMINRIEELGGFVTFIPLADVVIRNLVDRELGKVNKRISDPTAVNLKGVTLEVSDEVKGILAKNGYKPDMGARPLRKEVREKIQNPLGAWIMENKKDIAKYVAENGAAKIVIDSIASFAPKLVPAQEPAVAAAVSNDNKQSPASPKKKKLAP
jgi:ATP-dependent Clp protease ATP-binding subunit ClpC